LSFLVDCFSLGKLLFSPHYQFLQGGGTCYFPQTAAGPLYSQTGWISLALAPPPPDRDEMFLQFIRPPILSRRDATYPQAALVASRADVTLTWRGCSFTW
jgi:hypothetical protein